jgi:hypothetical protein
LGQIPTLQRLRQPRLPGWGYLSHSMQVLYLIGADTDPMAAATAEAARLGIPLTLHAGTVPDGGDTETLIPGECR